MPKHANHRRADIPQGALEELRELDLKMSGGIGVQKGIAPGVGVTIEFLRIARIGGEGVRTEEPGEQRIIVPRPVVIEVRAGIQFLPGVLIRHVDGWRDGGIVCAGRAVRKIREVLDLCTGLVGNDRRRAQMVLVIIVDASARWQRRHAFGPGKDHPRAARVLAFVELADIARRRTPHDLLHASIVTVVDKRRRLTANRDRERFVFQVVGEGSARSGGHVAVGVIGVTVAPRRGHGVRPHTA